MRGDATLFTRNDEVIAQWSIIDPILKAWKEDDSEPVHTYASGSAGPAAADELIAPRKWRGL
jgi:glucose-6-phosphate 1-dehydrogenase